MNVLVTGAGGYIGCVLTSQLLQAGHSVRAYDRFFWGQDPINRASQGLSGPLQELELVLGDLRDIPDSVFSGIDAVCHLAGLSNDPTAEYNPTANWEMNAIATKSIAMAAKSHGIKRFTFASSGSIYDSEDAGEGTPLMADESTRVKPRGAYSTSKKAAEDILLSLVDQDFAPVIFRQGTVFGYSERLRLDLVVNTFVKDALLYRELYLHGGGWMWRPLVDVEDVARVHVIALEAPLEKLSGQIFNVVENNYQVRQLAMLVAGSVSNHFRDNKVYIDLITAPQPKIIRNYRMSGSKLSHVLGFTPGRTVLESITDLIPKLPKRLEELGNPFYYNIKWMEVLESVTKTQGSFKSIY